MPDSIASSDQEREEAKAEAQVLASYFNALLVNGVERVEALKLTRDWQAERFAMLRGE